MASLEAAYDALARVVGDGKKFSEKDLLKLINEPSFVAALVDEPTGNSVMHLSAARHNSALFCALATLELDVPVEALGRNRRNHEAATPLHIAVVTNAPVAAVSAMIGAQCDIHAKDAHGQTPLYCAAALGLKPLVAELAKGYNARDAIERTRVDRLSPLHAAALGGHVETLDYLLQLGGHDSNDATATMASPLACAILSGQVDAVRAVLRAGANTQRLFCSGTGALDVARTPELRETAAALVAETQQLSSQTRTRGVLVRKMLQLLRDEDAYLQRCSELRAPMVLPAFANKTAKNPLAKQECEAFGVLVQRLETFLDTRQAVSRSIGQLLANFEGAATLDRVAEVTSDLLLKNASFFTTVQRYVMAMYSALPPLNDHVLSKLSKANGCVYLEPVVEDLLKLPTAGIEQYIQLFHSIQDEAVSVLNLPSGCSPGYASVLEELRQLQVKAVGIIEKLENKFRGERIQSQMHGEFAPFADASRKVLRTGMLTKSPGSGAGRAQRRFFILLSDVLLYAAPLKKKGQGYEFKGRLELVTAAVRDDPHDKQHSFGIVSMQKTFQIYAGSQAEKRVWLRDIDNAIKALQVANLKSLDLEDAEVAPLAGALHAATTSGTAASSVDLDSDCESASGGAGAESDIEFAESTTPANEPASAQDAAGPGPGADGAVSTPAGSSSAGTGDGAGTGAGAGAGASDGTGAGAGAGAGTGTGAGAGAFISLGAGAVRPAVVGPPPSAAKGPKPPRPDKPEALLRSSPPPDSAGGDASGADGGATAADAAHLRAEVAALRAELASRDADIEALRAALAAKDGALHTAQAAHAARVRDYERALAEANAAIEREAEAARAANEAAAQAASAAASAAEQAAILSELHAESQASSSAGFADPTPSATASASARDERAKAVPSVLASQAQFREAVAKLLAPGLDDVAVIKAHLKRAVDAVKTLQNDMAVSNLEDATIAFVQATKLVILDPSNNGARAQLSRSAKALDGQVDETVANFTASG